MAKVKIYLEFRNRRKIQIPVNPEELKITSPSGNDTTDIVGLGEILLLKPAALAEVEFESFIPEMNTSGGYVEKTGVKSKRFVNFINEAKENCEPVRFVVSGLSHRINIQMGIEDFEYWWEGGDEDMHYTLNLKQWKSYSAKVVSVAVTETTVPTDPAPTQDTTPRENVTKEVTIGCTVIVNGQLHRDSDGQGPGKVEVNATRKINFIKTGKPYPYHCTLLDGGWRGWVTADSVEVIS